MIVRSMLLSQTCSALISLFLLLPVAEATEWDDCLNQCVFGPLIGNYASCNRFDFDCVCSQSGFQSAVVTCTQTQCSASSSPVADFTASLCSEAQLAATCSSASTASAITSVTGAGVQAAPCSATQYVTVTMVSITTETETEYQTITATAAVPSTSAAATGGGDNAAPCSATQTVTVFDTAVITSEVTVTETEAVTISAPSSASSAASATGGGNAANDVCTPTTVTSISVVPTTISATVLVTLTASIAGSCPTQDAGSVFALTETITVSTGINKDGTDGSSTSTFIVTSETTKVATSTYSPSVVGTGTAGAKYDISNSTSCPSGVSTSAAAGIGAGSALGGMSLIALLGLAFFLKKRRDERNPHDQAIDMPGKIHNENYPDAPRGGPQEKPAGTPIAAALGAVGAATTRNNRRQQRPNTAQRRPVPSQQGYAAVPPTAAGAGVAGPGYEQHRTFAPPPNGHGHGHGQMSQIDQRRQELENRARREDEQELLRVQHDRGDLGAYHVQRDRDRDFSPARMDGGYANYPDGRAHSELPSYYGSMKWRPW